MRHSGRRPRGGTTRRRRRGTTTRVVLVDDYEPLRRLLKEALQERGCEVVAEPANGREELDAMRLGAEIVVMDFSMKPPGAQLEGVRARFRGGPAGPGPAPVLRVGGRRGGHTGAMS